jgi:hypothetical protein
MGRTQNINNGPFNQIPPISSIPPMASVSSISSIPPMASMASASSMASSSMASASASASSMSPSLSVSSIPSVASIRLPMPPSMPPSIPTMQPTVSISSIPSVASIMPPIPGYISIPQQPPPTIPSQPASFTVSSAISTITPSPSYLPNGRYLTTLLGSTIPSSSFIINNNQMTFSGCNTYQIIFNSSGNGSFKVMSSNNMTNKTCYNNDDNLFIAAVTSANTIQRKDKGELYLMKDGMQIIKCQSVPY